MKITFISEVSADEREGALMYRVKYVTSSEVKDLVRRYNLIHLESSNSKGDSVPVFLEELAVPLVLVPFLLFPLFVSCSNSSIICNRRNTSAMMFDLLFTRTFDKNLTGFEWVSEFSYVRVHSPDSSIPNSLVVRKKVTWHLDSHSLACEWKLRHSTPGGLCPKSYEIFSYEAVLVRPISHCDRTMRNLVCPSYLREVMCEGERERLATGRGEGDTCLSRCGLSHYVSSRNET